MSRKRFWFVPVVSLALVCAGFVGATLFLAYSRFPGYGWLCGLVFFACGLVVIVAWLQGQVSTIQGIEAAIRGMGLADWSASLPSSDIEEIWKLITEIHATRLALRDKILSLEGEREKLIRILSHLREGILVADPANRIVLVNEGGARILKEVSSTLLGKPLSDFMQGEHKAIFEALIRGEEKSETVPLGEKTILFRSFLSKNPDGSLAAKMAVLYDVTESKKLEEMRKVFVANASHELRSPAASLQSLLDAFQMGGLEEPGQRRKFLGMMEREVKRLNAIIRDLLDLAELERESEFIRRDLQVAKLFEEWLDSYRSQLQAKGIEPLTAFESKDVVISASVEDMEKLFRNLLENAIKYTPPGGRIEVGLRQEDGELEGWIKDTGLGIPPEHLGRIFERFYRVDRSRSRALGGTGLGLSIARHAVERHGGKIWAESREHEGATFRFTLPLTLS